MTKVTCDMCGKELTKDADIYDLYFKSRGISYKNYSGTRYREVCCKCMSLILNITNEIKDWSKENG